MSDTGRGPSWGFVWMVAWPDMRTRVRRFFITAVGMGLILAVTLLLSGFSEGFRTRANDLLDGFRADNYIVIGDAPGPFSSFSPIPQEVADPAALQVDNASALLMAADAIGGEVPTRVLVAGYELGSFTSPDITDGRAIERQGETVVDAMVPDVAVGDVISVGNRQLTVVGETEGATLNLAVGLIFVELGEAQQMFAQGAPVISTVATIGEPVVPTGLTVRDRGETFVDLLRQTTDAKKSIDAFKFTLWALAVVIVGAVLYLAALERIRDFAIFKATGAKNVDLLLGLMVQAVILGIVSSFLAIVLAYILRPIYPGILSFPLSVLWPVFPVAIILSVIGSVVGVRRAISVDPSQAFGGP